MEIIIVNKKISHLYKIDRSVINIVFSKIYIYIYLDKLELNILINFKDIYIIG